MKDHYTTGSSLLIVIGVSLVVVLLLASKGVAASDSLSLNIGATKAVYCYGEEIVVHVCLRNMTDDTLHILPISLPMVLKISDDAGKQLYDQGVFVNWIKPPSDRVPLSPGGVVEDMILLCENYGFAGENLYDTSCVSLGRRGITASYWRSIVSNRVVIEVKPTSPPDLNDYQALRSAVRSMSDRKQWNVCAQRLQQFVETHVGSRYLPTAFRNLLRITDLLKNQSRVLDVSLQIVERLPDDALSRDALLNATARQSEPENIAMLREIVRSKPGTLVAQFAQKLLDQKIGGNK